MELTVTSVEHSSIEKKKWFWYHSRHKGRKGFQKDVCHENML
jgi:hypothetical protein